MKMLATLVFVISLAATVLAHAQWRTISAAPGPEMGAGVLGMALAAGVLYLIKRRNRT